GGDAVPRWRGDRDHRGPNAGPGRRRTGIGLRTVEPDGERVGRATDLGFPHRADAPPGRRGGGPVGGTAAIRPSRLWPLFDHLAWHPRGQWRLAGHPPRTAALARTG